jgi:hypothetical protein
MTKSVKILDTDFKIKFDGEQHQIEANVLINSLIHTTSIIQELNRALDTGKKIDVKIKALEKGSFLIHIELIETALGTFKNLLTKDNIETASFVIGGLVGLIELKKFLGGKKEKSKSNEGDKVRIENESGDVIYVESFVQIIYERNPVVRDALSNNFETLDNDNSITGFEITDKNEKPLIRVDRDDFHTMAIKSEEIFDDEKIIVQSANLNIVRLSFDKKLKWEFYFKGNKVTVKVDDPNFQNRIDNGESFAKGDVLEVDLEIKQKFDSTVNTYVNKSYKIKKITNHIKREVPPQLDFS